MSPRFPINHYGFELANTRLSISNTAMVFLILLLAYRIGIIVYRLWFHPLSKFPGPKLWAASKLPFTYKSVKGQHILTFPELHRKYGPAVRIGPDRLVLDGSVGWPDVYARRSGGAAEFEKAPEAFMEGLRQSIIAAPRDVHRRQRRQLGHAFSDAAMYEQESRIEHFVQLLVRHIQEHADTGKDMNIVQWLNFTTFDIIGDLTFGESFGSLETSNYHPWVLSIFEGIRGDAFVRGARYYPLLAPLVIRLFGYKGAKKGEENRNLARNKGKARMALGLEPKGQRDFATYMLRPGRDGQAGLSEQEVMANSPLLVLAGSETTASALSGFFFYLNKTPRAKKTLIEEIRGGFNAESEITMVSTNKLEYLMATLEETLRVYPPAASTPARVSPGAEVTGRFVPKDTVIHVSQWATFRNPEHFAEPNAFSPERWLKHSHPLYDNKFDRDNHTVFKPFSTGPRDCIGKNLAYSEMRLIITNILFRFDVEMLPGQDDWHASQPAFTVWDKGPLYVRFAPRKQS